MIRVTNLSLTSRLENINLNFPEKGLIGIIGANGAGKSSLLKCLAGINTADSGEIYINQQLLTNMSYPMRGKVIGYIAQNTPIAWDISVYETLALGFIKKHSKPIQQKKIHAMAGQFALLPYLSESVLTLSGGEVARVHLARALIKEAPILLADEPIAALDPFYQIDIMQHLKQLAEKQLCIVVLHDLSLAYRFCDAIVLMKEGQILAYNNTEKVITNENLASAFNISATIDQQTKSVYNIKRTP